MTLNQIKSKLKKAHKSMTMWFNSTILMALPAIEYANAHMPQVKQFLGDKAYMAIGIGALVGNMLIRLKTTKDLADK